ncbi:MAG: class I tRNA ligase family protein, partial [Nitrospira sp.]|nr:class I tRNA ligase family protein [Nitrospira sp.]
LVTGLDILFFWVARMIMMGLKFTGEVPFRDVYIHALVRDAEGQKMSKSKGNVIDPLSVMEKYGTDALRFTLASMASPGRDIKLAEERIEGYRNFANKIWNAARFILMHLDGPRKSVPLKDRAFADRWLMSRLNQAIRHVNAALEQYRFDQAAAHLYQFIWHEYCDWYLELIKPTLQDKDSVEAQRTRQTLVESFETLLRLLHPFMPFLSEEVWQAVPHEGESIMTQPYPAPDPAWDAKDAEAAFALLEQFVTTARAGRVLLNYLPGKTVDLYGAARDQQASLALGDLCRHLAHLSRSTVRLLPQEAWPATNVLRMATADLTLGLLVEGEVDLQKVLDRVTKQKDEGKQEAKRLEGKLGNADFTAKAPPDVVAEHEQRLHTIRREQTILTDSEGQLRAMMQSRQG